MALNEASSDCVVCTFRVIFFLASLCGSFVIDASCPHSKRPTTVQIFTKSTNSVLFSLLFILPIILSTVYYFYDLSCTKNNQWGVIFKLSIILENIAALGLSIQGLVNCNKMLVQLNGLTLLIRNRKYYGFDTFLTNQLSEHLIKRRRALISILSLVMTLLLAHTITGRVGHESLPKFLFRMFLFSLNSYTQFISNSQAMLLNLLYKGLFLECHKEIKDILMKYITKVRMRKHFLFKEVAKVLPREIPVEERLKRLKSLYTSLFLNYKQFNAFNLPSIFVGLLVMIMMQINNFFALVLFYSNYDNPDVITTLRAYGLVIVTISFLVIAEGVGTVVSRFNYYRKYVIEIILMYLHKEHVDCSY